MPRSRPSKHWWAWSGWSSKIPEPDHNNIASHEGVRPRLVGMVRLVRRFNDSLFSLSLLVRILRNDTEFHCSTFAGVRIPGTCPTRPTRGVSKVEATLLSRRLARR